MEFPRSKLAGWSYITGLLNCGLLLVLVIGFVFVLLTSGPHYAAGLVAAGFKTAIPVIGLLAFILGIVGIVETSSKKKSGRGKAIAGTTAGAVTGIFSILAFIPVNVKPSPGQNGLTCSQNLHRIFVALQQYDHDKGAFPPDLATLWREHPQDLDGAVFVCPDSSDTPATDWSQLSNGGHLSYAYNPPESSSHLHADDVILFENTKGHPRGINRVYGDGRIDALGTSPQGSVAHGSVTPEQVTQPKYWADRAFTDWDANPYRSPCPYKSITDAAASVGDAKHFKLAADGIRENTTDFNADCRLAADYLLIGDGATYQRIADAAFKEAARSSIDDLNEQVVTGLVEIDRLDEAEKLIDRMSALSDPPYWIYSLVPRVANTAAEHGDQQMYRRLVDLGERNLRARKGIDQTFLAAGHSGWDDLCASEVANGDFTRAQAIRDMGDRLKIEYYVESARSHLLRREIQQFGADVDTAWPLVLQSNFFDALASGNDSQSPFLPQSSAAWTKAIADMLGQANDDDRFTQFDAKLGERKSEFEATFWLSKATVAAKSGDAAATEKFLDKATASDKGTDVAWGPALVDLVNTGRIEDVDRIMAAKATGRLRAGVPDVGVASALAAKGQIRAAIKTLHAYESAESYSSTISYVIPAAALNASPELVAWVDEIKDPYFRIEAECSIVKAMETDLRIRAAGRTH